MDLRHEGEQADVWFTKYRRKLVVCERVRNAQGRAQGGRAGKKIVGWNGGMAHRLGDLLSNFYDDFTVMVTLTYPDTFPKDGNTVKAHLKAFRERLRRTGWFKKYSFVWFLEFQERGAPHFHILATGFMSKSFVSRSWSEITGGNPLTCSRCESLKATANPAAYAMKYARKSEQKSVPLEYKNVGRMWGVSRSEEMRGRALCPALVAATPGAVLEGVSVLLRHFTSDLRARIYAGEYKNVTIYGTEKEIQTVWRRLQDCTVITGPTEKQREGSQQRTRDELQAMHSNPAKIVWPFAMKSKNPWPKADAHLKNATVF